jgi:hypothetical protein
MRHVGNRCARSRRIRGPGRTSNWLGQGRIAFADGSDLVMPDLDLSNTGENQGGGPPTRRVRLPPDGLWREVSTHAAIAMPFSMG